MRKSIFLPMRLQFFADTDTGGGSGGCVAAENGERQGAHGNQQDQTPAFDYDKIASIITGKQTVAEDSVLKGYFKQQGLSQEEAIQAMQAFKVEKAKNNPDVNAIQTQLIQAQAIAEKAEIERLATIEAVGLGIDVKALPYVLKMADLSSVKGQDGKVNQEAVKKIINKVLEDVPQLKPSITTNQGFQIGGIGASGYSNKETQEDMLKGIFGIKK
ncbi:MAG: hypothetical protein QM644_18405 [Mobilitalea sp.]